MKKYLLSFLLLAGGLDATAQCVASFTATSSPFFNDLLFYDFTNTSTYGTLINKQYVTANYSFGDGTSGCCDHLYSTPGTYTVGMRLRKYDSSNVQLCTDTTTQVISVAYPTCGTLLGAVTGSVLGPTRTFTAVTPAGTSGMSYSWDFGDGTTGTGSPVSHTYTNAGGYYVTLTAMHASPSCSYTNGGSVYIQLTSLNCSNFQAAIGKYITDTTVYVSDQSSFYFGTYKTVTYDYGAGSTAVTSHQYANTGAFPIKQKVTWYDSATSAVICTDSVTDTVHIKDNVFGRIVYDSVAFPGIQTFKVYLIQYDAATNLLAARDSLIVSDSVWIPYVFSNVNGGNYLVKAVCISNTVGLPGMVPTYHDSSLYWSAAQYLTPDNLSNFFYYFYSGSRDIWMKKGIATSGPGFIGGNVTLGANKGAGAGVGGLNVLLRNGAGSVIASTVTAASGAYAFPNLPAGSYTVFPEALNYTTSPAAAAISAAAPSVSDLVFYQDDVKKSIAPYKLGATGPVLADATVMLFPNPSKGTLTLLWRNLRQAGATVVITDLSGSKVYEAPLLSATTSGQQPLRLSGLAAGIYFLQLNGSGIKPVKLLIN